MKELFTKLDNIADVRESQLKNVLVLAFVGDTLFTTFVRTRLAVSSNYNAGVLNKLANKFVKASSQAKVYNLIQEKLTSEELDIGRRARNCKLHHSAKNATLEDYKDATSMESILGYNYLAGNIDRLIELMNLCYLLVENELDSKKV